MFGRRLAFLMLAVAALSVAAAPVHPKKGKSSAAAAGPHRPQSRSEAEGLSKKKRGAKVAVRRVYVKKMVHGHMVTVSHVVRANTGPVIPPHPDADRLQEIQQALTVKGYFKGEVNGQWNADSVEALRRFQTARNLPGDGKINSLSLIGLGLGPKHDGSAAASASAPVTPQTSNPQ